MPYTPPKGWVEQVSPLERENVFHEDRSCAQVQRRDDLVPAARPGRSRQCEACVRNTAQALLRSA